MGQDPSGSTTNGSVWLRRILPPLVLRAVATVAILITAGCGSSGEGRTASLFTETDSAGVWVVQNQTPVWADGEEWQVGEVLTMVGRAEGDPHDLLYGVFDGTRLSDGGVVVANSGTSELRFFDSRGEFVRAVGRTGGGPGEFRSEHTIRALVRRPGDTLVTWDIYGQNLSVFSPGGDFLRASRMTLSGRMYFWSGMFRDGTLLMALNNPDNMPMDHDGLYARPVRLVHVSQEGDSLGVVLDYDAGTWHVLRQGPMMLMAEAPFSRIATCRVQEDRIYLALGEDYEYLVLDESGAPVLISRKPHDWIPVTETHRARYLEEELEHTPEHLRATIRRAVAGLPLPEFFPPYRDMRVDSESNVWLQDYPTTADAPNDWTVFGPDGRWLGSVSLPDGLEVYEIGPDYVLGKVEDELEVERVTLYALVKDRGRGGGRR